MFVPDLSEARNSEVVEYYNVLRETAVKFSLLGKWLEKGMPMGLPLPLPEVVDFLEVTGPELERAGFGIRMPAWCGGEGQRRRLSLTASCRGLNGGSTGALTLDSVVHFDWELALGEERLTVDELTAIAQLKVPLVQLRGKWIHLSAEELRAVSDLLQNGAQEQRPMRELVRFAICDGEVEGLPVRQVIGSGELENILERLEGRRAIAELPPPKGLRATLRPYQHRGYSWLAFMADLGMGACLADDMGLGKTVQALALLQRRWEEGIRRPSLLVCPMSVIGNWVKEARRFVPTMSVKVHQGEDRTSQPEDFSQRARNHPLVITSYSLLARDADILRSVPWSGVVLDEAQNIKNPETKQAKAAMGLSAKYRIALTGTPVENNVRDLWSVMEFLNPGFLGTWEDFLHFLKKRCFEGLR